MSTKSKIKMRKSQIDDLRFFQMPQDGGQIVSVTYACDESGVYCRTVDQSYRPGTPPKYQFAAYDRRCGEDRLRFEPQNGLLPQTSTWRDVIVQ